MNDQRVSGEVLGRIGALLVEVHGQQDGPGQGQAELYEVCDHNSAESG